MKFRWEHFNGLEGTIKARIQEYTKTLMTDPEFFEEISHVLAQLLGGNINRESGHLGIVNYRYRNYLITLDEWEDVPEKYVHSIKYDGALLDVITVSECLNSDLLEGRFLITQ